MSEQANVFKRIEALTARKRTAKKSPSPEVVPVAPTRGLGDLVASVAQPIARAIDTVAGTRVASCGGCKARQAALNRALPFATTPQDPSVESQRQ